MGKKNHAYTVGIEEEFQIIDPQTRELRSHSQEIIKDGQETLEGSVKSELHQSIVELRTEVCPNIPAARRQVTELRSELAVVAARDGLKIASAGTHPFSRWQDQSITETVRHLDILQDMQHIARSNVIFGLHVHVAIADRAAGIDIMNQARSFLPHLDALSVNSPFWEGQNTGLKAYRHAVFERFPRTGIPEAFASLAEYQKYLDLLVTTGCIDNAKKIWWDVRLHPFFDTIEFRICDAQSRIDDTIALAALMQAIVVQLDKLRDEKIAVPIYPRNLLEENRWRASRYGLDGELIDFEQRRARGARELVRGMLEFVAPAVDELSSQAELSHIEKIMREGAGADRQIAVWKRTRDMKAVVDHIVKETNDGLQVA